MGATLAIDTSAGTTVALVRNGVLVVEAKYESNLGHAESIGTAIAETLSAAPDAQVISVVVGRGPAPFTGLRIGIAAAMMFAEGAKAQLSGVISLDAIALLELESNSSISTATPLLITTDARRKEVYYALYSGLNSHGVPIRIDGPAVIKPEALREMLIDKNIYPVTTNKFITASAIARLAEAQQRDGSLSHDVSALYLRQPDAVEGQFGKKVSG
jgi:tRNA threonylcarbamoyl adenosine modification protein YeaZ